MAECDCTQQEITIYLDQQGPPGRQGDPGVDGFNPEVTVVTNTDQQYVLRIATKDNLIITPNLKGRGLPTGGLPGDYLTKETASDYDAIWVTPPQIYTQEQIDEMFASLTYFDIEVVDELPEEGERGILYFVPNADGNTYDIWVWVPPEDPNPGHFLRVGNTETNLDDYYTKEEIGTLLATKQNNLVAGAGINLQENPDETVTISASLGDLDIYAHIRDGIVNAPNGTFAISGSTVNVSQFTYLFNNTQMTSTPGSFAFNNTYPSGTYILVYSMGSNNSTVVTPCLEQSFVGSANHWESPPPGYIYHCPNQPTSYRVGNTDGSVTTLEFPVIMGKVNYNQNNDILNTPVQFRNLEILGNTDNIGIRYEAGKGIDITGRTISTIEEQELPYDPSFLNVPIAVDLDDSLGTNGNYYLTSTENTNIPEGAVVPAFLQAHTVEDRVNSYQEYTEQVSGRKWYRSSVSTVVPDAGTDNYDIAVEIAGTPYPTQIEVTSDPNGVLNGNITDKTYYSGGIENQGKLLLIGNITFNNPDITTINTAILTLGGYNVVTIINGNVNISPTTVIGPNSTIKVLFASFDPEKASITVQYAVEWNNYTGVETTTNWIDITDSSYFTTEATRIYNAASVTPLTGVDVDLASLNLPSGKLSLMLYGAISLTGQGFRGLAAKGPGPQIPFCGTNNLYANLGYAEIYIGDERTVNISNNLVYAQGTATTNQNQVWYFGYRKADGN